MNNSLIKKNAGMIMLVIVLVVVLIFITKNPISNSVFGATSPIGKIYNTTGTALSLCYKNSTGTYTWFQIPGWPSGTQIPTITNPGIMLILKGNSTNTGAPTAADIVTGGAPYAYSFISGGTVTSTTYPDTQPSILLCDVTTFLPAVSNTLLTNTVSGINGSDLILDGVEVGKSIIIFNTFKVTDYSTKTDTGETVGNNSYNYISINEIVDATTYNLFISRFIMSNYDSINSTRYGLTTATGLAVVGNTANIYGYRSANVAANAAASFTSTYYLPPYITLSGVQVIPDYTTVPVYMLKYTATPSTTGGFDTLDKQGQKQFFYGPEGTTGMFYPRDNNFKLTNSTIGNIVITMGAGTITVVGNTTPTAYEIRYIDTIISNVPRTLTFYPLIKSGTDYTAGTYTGTAGTNVITVPGGYDATSVNGNPPFMPYVVELPASTSMTEGITNYPSGTSKTIFRSVNNKNIDVKYISTVATIPPALPKTATANLASIAKTSY